MQIDDLRIHVEVKDVRTMRLRYSLREKAAVLSAPPGVGRERAEAFVRANVDWIRRAAERAVHSSISQPPPRGRQLEIFAEAAAARMDARSREMGVRRPMMRLRHMTSCWGLCRVREHCITLNTALVYEPAECLDYVVVHELAHLFHADHSSAFWAKVERHCPEFRKWRSHLRR